MDAEDQILGLLNKEDGLLDNEADDLPEEELPEGEELDEDEDPDQEEDEESDEPTEEELEELTYKGETKRLTKAELKELAEKGFDYTQKTQTLAEERRAVEQHRAEIEAARNQFAEHLALQEQMQDDFALVRAIDLQIQQFANVDFDQLEPEKKFELKDRLRDLKEARAELTGRVESAQRAILADRQRETAKLIQQGREQLKRDIPDFSAETVKQIYESAQSLGFTPEEIGAIVDPRAIKALHKAMLYDRLQATKADTTKRVSKAPPVVRPGAAAPRKGEERAKSVAKMRQSGGRVEDAASILVGLLK